MAARVQVDLSRDEDGRLNGAPPPPLLPHRRRHGTRTDVENVTVPRRKLGVNTEQCSLGVFTVSFTPSEQ